VVQHQLQAPTKRPSKPTASSSRESYYYYFIWVFICHTFQLEDAITDVDIKAKLALRGTAVARKELKDWRRAQSSWYVKLQDSNSTEHRSDLQGPGGAVRRCFVGFLGLSVGG
jgi:hypothetical protein